MEKIIKTNIIAEYFIQIGKIQQKNTNEYNIIFNFIKYKFYEIKHSLKH